MTKPTKWNVHPAKTQISLGICQVWSESSLNTLWVAKDPKLLHADCECPCWSEFAGHTYTCHLFGFVMLWLQLIKNGQWDDKELETSCQCFFDETKKKDYVNVHWSFPTLGNLRFRTILISTCTITISTFIEFQAKTDHFAPTENWTVLAEDIEMTRKVSWNWQLSSMFMSYHNDSKLLDRKVYIHEYPNQTAQRSKPRKEHSDQSLHYLSHLATKSAKWLVRPAKIRISLGIHLVWSVFAVHSIGS